MFFGCPPIAGSLTFGICSSGQQALVFSVILVFSQSTSLESPQNNTFSRTEPNFKASKISGSFSWVRPIHFAQQPPSMLNIPASDQTCSSSPINYLLGSADNVVLPVPERPKRTLTSPSLPSLAEAWSETKPFFGIKQFITVKIPFFISPAYQVPAITNFLSLKLTAGQVFEPIPSISAEAGNSPALKMWQSGSDQKSL